MERLLQVIPGSPFFAFAFLESWPTMPRARSAMQEKKIIADNRTWWIPSSTSGSLTGYIGSKLTSSRILFEPSGSKAALNKHLSLWMTFELWQLYRIYKWNSCLTQLHLPGRGWTNLSPLFNNWDDAGLPLLPARSWDIFLLAGIAMSSWRGTKRSEDFIFLKA